MELTKAFHVDKINFKIRKGDSLLAAPKKKVLYHKF